VILVVDLREGHFAFFFGKTPLSKSEAEIIPASAVNIVGKIEEPDRLKRIGLKGGEQIRIMEVIEK
jgi:hypothetical protein